MAELNCKLCQGKQLIGLFTWILARAVATSAGQPGAQQRLGGLQPGGYLRIETRFCPWCAMPLPTASLNGVSSAE